MKEISGGKLSRLGAGPKKVGREKRVGRDGRRSFLRGGVREVDLCRRKHATSARLRT